MPNENNQQLIAQLQKIRELLDLVIDLVGSDKVAAKAIARPKKISAQTATLDFDLPERAFFNRYAQSLSGPEKFALVVAYLAKGDESKEIPMRDIEDRWDKMTSLLGMFNRAHPTRAKDRDLVNSSKKGSYHLRPNWREIIE